MDAIFLVAVILMILGVVGSILPVVPGPILSFAGLVVYYIFQENEVLSLGPVLLFALGMVFLIAADYALPILGVKFLGASKSGQWGAVIGALLGIVFFPPLGIFVGALAGAVIGEMIRGKKFSEAMRVALGVITGSVAAIILQVIFSLSVLIYFLFKII